MKIVVIGASGFVGSYLLSDIKESYSVKNIDKNKSALHPDVTFIGDIRDKETFAHHIKEAECVVLLAAEHRDDVTPIDLYYQVNVQGTKNVLDVMTQHRVKNIVFTSSVAIYGLNKQNPDEANVADPFNHYGKSKWQAEELLKSWYNEDKENRAVTILRPTVIFGERNRGNVYNLLKQIVKGRFVMVGSGRNYKSMAYVRNVTAFIRTRLDNLNPGYNVFNYADKPDLSINDLVLCIQQAINKKPTQVKIPYWLGMLGGYGIDLVSMVTRKKFSISSVRIKKFCATTQFDASRVQKTRFVPPYTLLEALNKTIEFEFIHNRDDDTNFISE